MVVRVPITRDVLEWAVHRTGSTIEELAENSDLAHIEDWLKGESSPTIRQAEILAKKAALPYPVLLLEQPQPRSLDLPDFRTIDSRSIHEPSVELEQVIDRASLQLDFYIDYVEEVGLPAVEIIGMATLDSDPETAAEELRSRLGWEPGSAALGGRAVAELADAIESLGVLVTRNSIVGNATRKPLSVDEFRGFTLIRQGQALIFVNTRDAKSAQLFSLGHELGHVLLGQPGISAEEDTESTKNTGRGVETWCNKFSASLLMPKAKLQQAFVDADITLEGVSALAHRFGVSVPALCYRISDLGIITRSQAEALLSNYGVPVAIKQSGGDSYRNIKARVGSRLLVAIRDSIGTDLLSSREALNLVGATQYKTLDGVFELVEGSL